MVDDYGILLPLSVEALVGLLVQLQTPRQPEPNHMMSATLEVQTVGTRRGMRQQNVNLASVPVRLIRRALIHPHV